MAKDTGKNAAISFGGTIYRCLTDVAMSGGVESASAACSTETGNAVTHKAVGAENWTATTTILLDGDTITAETAFAPGTSGALIVYPNGNAVGQKSLAWTSAFVSSDNEATAVATQSTMALTFECDGARTPLIIT